MATPHKHADVIKAWADGAQVQSRTYESDEWRDSSGVPLWNPDRFYRVKPNTVRFRLYARKACGSPTSVYSITLSDVDSGFDQHYDAGRIKAIELSHGFIRWLGDVQEVEV